MEQAGKRLVLGLSLCCLLLGACQAEQDAPPPPKTADPPVYTINLDLAPEKRWAHVLEDYMSGKHGKVNLTAFIQQVIDSYVPAAAQPLVEEIAANLDRHFPPELAGEIRGIAKGVGCPLGWAVAASVLYDVSAFCTSIVAQDDAGQIWHGRNLDYSFAEALRQLTFVAHFQRNGTTVYSGVTYAGIVGLFTGQKAGVFTVSEDERDKGFWWENAVTALLSLFDRKATLVSFLARQTLEKAQTFDEAVDMLAHTITWAPGYYIVGGVKPGEGAVITRDRLGALDIWHLEPYNTRWFLLETNYDHWTTPPPSDDRRGPGMAAMEKEGQKGFNQDTLFRVLSTPKVLNNGTTYTTVMSAKDPTVFKTWIRLV